MTCGNTGSMGLKSFIFLLFIAFSRLSSAESFPEEAEKLVAEAARQKQPVSMESFGELMTDWAKKDPAAASAWAGKLSNEELRKNALVEIYSEWFTADKDAAAKSAAAVKAERKNSKMLKGIAIAWGKSDPRKALEWANGDLMLFACVYYGWAEKDFQAAVASMETEKKFKQAALLGIISRLEKNDIGAAAKWALELKSEKDRKLAVGWVVSKWYKQNHEESMKWASALPDESLRTKAVDSIISEMAQADPELAAKTIQERALTDTMDTYNFHKIADRWAKKDPASAEKWALSLSKTEARDSALGGLIRSLPIYVSEQWTRKDMDTASKWCLMIADKKVLSANLESIAFNAAKRPEDGHYWILSMPEGSVRNQAFCYFIKNIKKENLEKEIKWAMANNLGDATAFAVGALLAENISAAENFIHELPAGSLRNKCIIQLAIAKVIDSRNANSVKWALAFKSHDDRASAIAGLSMHDIKEIGNTATAEKWIRAQSVSEEEKTLAIKLLKEFLEYYAPML